MTAHSDVPTTGRPAADGPSATRSLFDARSFLAAMRLSEAGASTAALLELHPDLAPVTLDERPDAAACWVTGIYALVLQRQVDATGLQVHSRTIREGTPPAHLLEQILTSPEAIALGTSQHPDLSEIFVTGLYLVGLGRPPDARGLATQVAALAAGASEASLVERMLESDEAKLQQRFPPPPADLLDFLPRRLQTTGMGTDDHPEHTAWGRDALLSGAHGGQVVRSLARRLRGVTAGGVYGALTSRSRSIAAEQAALLDAIRADLARERAWQWDLHRATWRRLDRLERPGSWGKPLPADDAEPTTTEP